MSIARGAPFSPVRVVVSVLMVGAAFAAGMTVMGPKEAARVTGAIAGVLAVAAGASQFVGEIWPRGQRWMSYFSVVAAAGALGVFARMAVQLISKAL